MQAIFTDPDKYPRLILRETMVPTPADNQALIKVAAFSLNQGETRTAMAATTSYTPGWDFAGVIVQTAEDGSTPKEDVRVFGFLPQGSWAEYIAVPATLMAEIPEGITDAQAATLPVAGLTARACLDEVGALKGRRVLITGAAGGVGRFVCQLAALAEASVFAVSSRPGLSHLLEADGILPEKVFTSMAEAKAAGQYDVILDSVGGDTLALALTALTRDGVCVNYGNSSRQPTTVDVRATGWPFHRMQCIWLGRELPPDSRPALTQLIQMVKEGRLHTPIDGELSWTRVAEAAERLVRQGVNGKIVLHVD